MRTNDETRPGIVHRLDKDTSGLLIVAKHDAAREYVARQLRERTAEKRYLALVHGAVPWDERAVEAPIGRDSSAPHEDGGRARRTPCAHRLPRPLSGSPATPCSMPI